MHYLFIICNELIMNDIMNLIVFFFQRIDMNTSGLEGFSFKLILLLWQINRLIWNKEVV